MHLVQLHPVLVQGHDLVLAGKVTHGIGTIVKVLIGFGILIGIVIALVVTSLFRRK